MPIYTYRCQRCGSELRKKQSFAEARLTECPACGAGVLRRVIQLPEIIFKGSGWYSTDHRTASRAAPRRPRADKTEAADDDKPGEGGR